MRVKSIIGLVGNILISDEKGPFAGDLRSCVNDDYVQMIIKCGGIPVVIPVQANKKDILEIIKRVDGIILTGGYDIDPLLYNENPMPELGLVMREVDEFYLKAIECADELHKPILGICKGIQALNVAYGGSLYQDLKSQKSDCLKHRQDTFKYKGTHYVNIEKDNILYDLFKDRLLVNSYHHQSVKDIADGFRVMGYPLSEKGIAVCRQMKLYNGCSYKPAILSIQNPRQVFRTLFNLITWGLHDSFFTQFLLPIPR